MLLMRERQAWEASGAPEAAKARLEELDKRRAVTPSAERYRAIQDELSDVANDPKLTPAEKHNRTVDLEAEAAIHQPAMLAQAQKEIDAEQAALAPRTPPLEPFTRTTPALGTPEREKLEANYKSVSAAKEENWDTQAKFKKEFDKTKYGTKKREEIEKRLEKLRDVDSQLTAISELLRKQVYLAALEYGAAQTENPVLAIASRAKLADMVEDARTGPSMGQKHREAVQKAREDAIEAIRQELTRRVPAILSGPLHTENDTKEVAALTPGENEAAERAAVGDVAQRFMEHPLTADKVDKTLDGALHAHRVKQYQGRANAVVDQDKKERWRAATHIISGGDRIFDAARNGISNAYDIDAIDRAVATLKEEVSRAVATQQAVEKDQAAAKVTLSSRSNRFPACRFPKLTRRSTSTKSGKAM